jgi:hypothetical protein
VRLIGRGYDLQHWDADDRLAEFPMNSKYESSRYQWIKDIIDPWRKRALKNMVLFVGSVCKEHAVLHANFLEVDGEQDLTVKEIIVYRYPRVFHVFNLIEYGRRWYRSLIFSSDPSIVYHDLPVVCLKVGDEPRLCSGDPTQPYIPERSLMVSRDVSNNHTEMQHFIPTRLLYGVLPSMLIEMYNFWQNDDDSLTGYMPILMSEKTFRFVLRVRPESNELRTFTIWRVPILESKKSDIVDATFDVVIDNSKPVLYMVSLMQVFSHYAQANPNILDDDTYYTSTLEGEFLNFPSETTTLHALVRLMLRLDSLAGLLAWSRSNPAEGPVSIDVVEIPRLRLTFEKVVKDTGVRYICIEQNGLTLAGYKDHLRFRDVLDGLPQAVLLCNDDEEFFVLNSGAARPILFKSKDGKNSDVLALARTDKEWYQNAGESAYFVYPIHSSGCFISSRSISSTLFLLLVRLLVGNYKESFKLIESCVCDRPLTVQEKQIYDVISQLKYDVHPDAHACRLKLFFVTFGCSDIMPYPFCVEDEILAYIIKFWAISAYCRLSYEEEAFIMAQVPQGSLARTIHFRNRENIIKASYILTFDGVSSERKFPFRSFKPLYPEQKDLEVVHFYNESVDLDLLDVTKPNFRTIIRTLVIERYKKAEKPILGVDAIKYFYFA